MVGGFITNFLAVLVAVPWIVSGNGLWTRLNRRDVCVEGREDRPGVVMYTGPSKMVGALKLVYKSGDIRCATNPAYKSRWGCYQLNAILETQLNMIVTDSSKNVLYPLAKYLAKGHSRAGMWYYLPFTDSLYSEELVFTNYLDPFYLPKHQILMFWMGEDLRDWYEKDNVGRVCFDVYAHML